MTLDDLVKNPAKCDELLKTLDETIKSYEYGLPLYEPEVSRLREIIYRWIAIGEPTSADRLRRIERLEELARAVIRKHAGAGLRGSSYDLVAMAMGALKP